MKKFIQESWLVLMMGIIFAVLLACTQTSLSGRIAENQVRALNEAIGEVVPAADRVEALEIDGNQVFRCFDAENKLSGWAVEASGMGFVDNIRLVVGLSPTLDRIVGLKVIENVETPGLGNKITEPAWVGQYRDLSTDKPLEVIKGKASTENNEIAAITGATWSSRYVTDIVNDVLTRIRPQLVEKGSAD